MKIIRYRDRDGRNHYGSEQSDGSAQRIEGDVFGQFAVTSERADVSELLAPVVPTQFFCIGLNYRRHAEETNAKTLPVTRSNMTVTSRRLPSYPATLSA